MKRRVVITGMGAVTPIGNDLQQSWQGVRSGRCGIAPITAYDTSGRKVKVGGEVKDLDVTSLAFFNLTRVLKYPGGTL